MSVPPATSLILLIVGLGTQNGSNLMECVPPLNPAYGTDEPESSSA